jgi:uncharacterized protein (TIGR00730 family)
MSAIKSICVYCGASLGNSPEYLKLAQEMGRQLARRRIRLVYGGGRVGLMGALADAALAEGGRVIGIIPDHLQAAEVGHDGLSELRVVESMHARKRLMFDLSDAFVVLPGGFGTLDETFEIVTWRQLGLHDKPIVLVDQDGYWEPFLDLIDHLILAGFAKPAARQNFSVAGGVARLFDLLEGAIETHEPSYPERI